MPGPVNNHPLGLLSLLGLKSMGMMPSDLLEQYRPTIEVRDLIAVANADRIQTAPIALVGATSHVSGFTFTGSDEFQTASNELMIVTQWSVTTSFIGAGAAVSPFTAGYNRVGAAVNQVQLFTDQLSPARTGLATALRGGLGNCQTFIIIPPGSGLGVFTSEISTSVVGGNIDIYLSVTRIKLRI